MADAAETGSTAAASDSSGFLNYLSENWDKLLIVALILAFVIYAVYFLRKRVPIVAEFMMFLKERKLWWMTPIVVVFVLLAAVIVVMEGSAIAPFIYALF